MQGARFPGLSKQHITNMYMRTMQNGWMIWAVDTLGRTNSSTQAMLNTKQTKARMRERRESGPIHRSHRIHVAGSSNFLMLVSAMAGSAKHKNAERMVEGDKFGRRFVMCCLVVHHVRGAPSVSANLLNSSRCQTCLQKESTRVGERAAL